MCFSGISFLLLFYKPTITFIDWSFLCQWANVQNQQGITFIFIFILWTILIYTSNMYIYTYIFIV